ncbi:MAG TPA: FtsQ-type POTRA domain-containing protein [Candidatus Dojkabacteria bacterium]|nr:FtsQ-type POTRA domain-containing protein [Candidatus Dojkabacteria bacterium]HRO64679.1 FtsQ-type POTRA domain-containing protein [Candidatus Dojkabacteria bacterium]HRP51025.1 FtsQ-type POTRA domain-containing protein [Candidatus Dojkabacteria bacterium]
MAYGNYKAQPKYSSLRRKRRMNVVRTPDISGSRNIFLGVIALLIIVLLIFSLLKFITSGYFNIKELNIIGLRGIEYNEVDKNLSEYYEENILFISSNELERKLSESFPSFKSVKVKKFWPNKIQIYISEKQPLLYYVNFTGVYIVDEDGLITKIIYSDQINFNDEQLNVITGAEGINSKLVVERLASEYALTQEELPDGEKVDFDFNTVPIDRKFEMLNTIREELIDQSLTILQNYALQFDPSVYPDLKTVYVFENKKYEIREPVDENRVTLTSEVLRFLTLKNITIVEVNWEGKFLVRFKTDTGKQYIFGTTRVLSEQLEDFEILLAEFSKENKNYSEFDFSSRKVSVK